MISFLIEQLRSQITNLKTDDKEAKETLILNIKKNIINLKEALNIWKVNHTVYSEAMGLVSFKKSVWTENQYVSTDAPFATIVPQKNPQEKMKVKATLPLINAGKVNMGDKGLLHLESYPSKEYGVLECRVIKKSIIPDEEGYLLDLEMLNDDLITSYGIQIPSEQNLTGEVKINTQNRTVLSRVFNQISNLLKNK